MFARTGGIHEPIPGAGRIAPPSPLPDDAQAVWDRLGPDLIAKRVLTTWDVDMFSVFCHAVAIACRDGQVGTIGEWICRK